jgi:biopolymer transport protein ExbD
MKRDPGEPGPLFRSGLLPMVDVGFLLLIAFLSSIRFVGLEGKVAAQLPRHRCM